MISSDQLPWEDSLLERKLESDQKDFCKTFVAFANSVRLAHTAIVLIGEKDDGAVQGVTDPDEMQKKIRRECERICPDIIWRSQVYEKSSKHCVRVEIEYSGNTPHFGDSAWVRRGSETVKANADIFQRLIDLRSSMVRELTQWLNKDIFIAGDEGSVDFRERTLQGHPRWQGTRKAKLLFVNGFWATFNCENRVSSEPLEKLILSWHDGDNCLKILVKL